MNALIRVYQLLIRVNRKYKLNRKKILIAVLVLDLTVIPLLLLFNNFRAKQTSAAWWDDTWAYRKSISIPSHTNPETNVYITVPAFDATDTTKFQSDCGDLRFTKQNGELLPYYVVSCSATADIHVYFDTLPAGASTYYMYYGNPSASNDFENADFATAASGLGSLTLNSEEKSNGPVAYWKFDEGYGSASTDSGALKIQGNISGAIWQTEDNCVSGKCLQFSNTSINSNYVSVNDSNPLDQTENMTISAWYKAIPQPTSNANIKVLVIEEGASGAVLKTQYTNAGYNVVTDLGLTTVADVATYSAQIVLCDKYAWGCTKQSLYNSLYDAGYNIVTKGNDSSAGLYPIATSHGGTHSNTTIAPDEKHPLGNGWSSTGNSGSDTGNIIDTINSSAISIAKNQAGFIEVAYLEQPNKGRWFHYQSYGTLDATLFTNLNSFILRYNVIGKGKNYNLYTYNGNLYGAVNNKVLSGTTTYNTWNHVQLVYDKSGGNINLYQNGKLLSTTAYSTALDTDAMKLSSGTLMKGFIDDLKIYSYARSTAQVALDYNSGLAGSGSVKGTSVSIGDKSDKWLSDGLVGYWKMEEATWSGQAAEVVDSSGNGNNGVASGPSNDKPYTLGGKFGNGGKFDGLNDYVSLGNNAVGVDINGASGTTVSYWVNLSGTPTAGNTFQPIGIVIGDSAAGLDSKIDSNRNISFGGRSSLSDNFQNVGSTGTLTEGTWTHVTGIYDYFNKKIYIYINGTLDTSQTVSFAANTYTNSWTSGADLIGNFTSQTRYLNGKIDDVRIYNRTLSPSEVSQLYAWAPGPVGYWNMDEKTGSYAYDKSSNGNTCTLTNSPTWSNGKFGGAMSYVNPTNNFLTCGNNSSLTVGTNDFTISTWIYPELWALNKEYSFIYRDHDSGSDNGYEFELGTWGQPTDKYIVSAYTLETTTPGYQHMGDSSFTINKNTWSHIAVVRQGTSLTWYLNGIKYNTYTATPNGTNLSPSTSFMIGKSAWGTDQQFQGKMDEVKIYNYARSTKQVVEDMNGSHPAGGSPVGSQVAYYKFDEGFGTAAKDSVGNNPNLNFAGTPKWSNDCKFGKCINFDTDDTDYASFTVPSSSPFNLGSSDFTVSNWQKVPQPTTFGSGILGRYPHNTSYNGNWVTGILDNRTTYFFTHRNTSGTVAFSNGIDYTPYFNQWTYTSWVKSGSKMYLYINGKQASSWDISTAFDITFSGVSFYFSQTGWSPGVMNGLMIDEFKLYNSALTADEIKLDYNQGKSMVLGSVSDTSGLTGGSVASTSASAAYCVPGDTNPCNPPVGEWNFDEKYGNSAYDTSGNNLTGTLTNSPTWSIGKNDGGIQTTGSNYVNITTSDGLSQLNNPHSNFTVSAWFKTTSYHSTQGEIFGNSTVDGWWYLSVGNGVLNMTTINTAWGCYNCVSGTTRVDDGKWHHATWVFADPAAYIYLDGKLEASNPTSTGTLVSGFVPGSSGIRIGVGYLPNNQYFTGTIDQVRLFNYSRTPAQIAWDYNKGKPVGLWRFDECSGGTAYDSSGNNNNGTITIGGTAPQSVLGTCTTPTDGTGAWYNGRNGKYNSSMSFDGADDYVKVNDTSTLDITGPVTVSTWVYYNTIGAGWKKIVGKWNETGNQRSYAIVNDTTGNYFEFIADSNGTGSNFCQAINYATPVTGTWYHVTGIYDGSRCRIYVNGNEGTPVNYSSGIYSGSANLITGGSGGEPVGGQNNYINGKIDDVKIYNYALTRQQVLNDYNQSSAVRFGPATGTP
jgi:hypothetical protein